MDSILLWTCYILSPRLLLLAGSVSGWLSLLEGAKTKTSLLPSP